MKLAQVAFVEAVRSIDTDRPVFSFVHAESPTRAEGYGYDLEAGDAGVFAKHPRKEGVERFIPWANVKWVDVLPGQYMPKLTDAEAAALKAEAQSWLGEIKGVPTLEAADLVGAMTLDGPPIEEVPPKKEHWKTRQKREREEANAVQK